VADMTYNTEKTQ